MPACVQVKDFQGIVANHSHEKPLTLQVHSQVVNTPHDTWQRYCLDELKRRGVLGVSSDYRCGKDCDDQSRMECLHYLSSLVPCRHDRLLLFGTCLSLSRKPTFMLRQAQHEREKVNVFNTHFVYPELVEGHMRIYRAGSLMCKNCPHCQSLRRGPDLDGGNYLSLRYVDDAHIVRAGIAYHRQPTVWCEIDPIGIVADGDVAEDLVIICVHDGDVVCGLACQPELRPVRRHSESMRVFALDCKLALAQGDPVYHLFPCRIDGERSVQPPNRLVEVLAVWAHG